MQIVAIGIMGLTGVFSRYAIDLIFLRYPAPIPYGTFLINILGSFLAGVLFVIGSERNLIPPMLQPAIMVGFLGGFTTFSSYALQSAKIFSEGQWIPALIYFGLSPLLGLAAAFLGLWIARSF